MTEHNIGLSDCSLNYTLYEEFKANSHLSNTKAQLLY